MYVCVLEGVVVDGWACCVLECVGVWRVREIAPPGVQTWILPIP